LKGSLKREEKEGRVQMATCLGSIEKRRARDHTAFIKEKTEALADRHDHDQEKNLKKGGQRGERATDRFGHHKDREIDIAL